MRYDDPNRPVSANSHTDPKRDKRYLKCGYGDVPHDGYSLVARAPRVKGMGDQTMDPERADRIERAFGVGDQTDGSDHGY